MKYKVSEQKRTSFREMAALLGMPYKTAHFRWRSGYSLSDSLLAPIGELRRAAQLKHGMHGSREYGAWENMHSRCRGQDHYVSRGIKVCDRWSVFENFASDMGPVPDGATLDRWPDGRGNYEPGNCRWATMQQQSQNTSRNVNLTWQDKTRCVAEWARIVGLSEKTIGDRIRRGWTAEQALTLPQYTRVL